VEMSLDLHSKPSLLIKCRPLVPHPHQGLLCLCHEQIEIPTLMNSRAHHLSLLHKQTVDNALLCEPKKGKKWKSHWLSLAEFLPDQKKHGQILEELICKDVAHFKVVNMTFFMLSESSPHASETPHMALSSASPRTEENGIRGDGRGQMRTESEETAGS
jgi:hypothetical protein